VPLNKLFKYTNAYCSTLNIYIMKVMRDCFFNLIFRPEPRAGYQVVSHNTIMSLLLSDGVEKTEQFNH